MNKKTIFGASLLIPLGAVGVFSSSSSIAQVRTIKAAPVTEIAPSRVSKGKAYFVNGNWYLPGQSLPRAGSGSNSGQTNLAQDINCAQVPCPDVFMPGVTCWKCK